MQGFLKPHDGQQQGTVFTPPAQAPFLTSVHIVVQIVTSEAAAAAAINRNPFLIRAGYWLSAYVTLTAGL